MQQFSKIKVYLVSGGSIRNGKILQRFPEQDWPDTPFFEGIEWFCQPQGWSLSTHQQEPQFFISVLTNIDGNHHYCACLSFNEKVSITPSKPVDEEEENIGPTKGLLPATPTITHHNIMYAPKCLTLVSKLDYPETFRVSLEIFLIKEIFHRSCFLILELPRHYLHSVFGEFAISTGDINWKHFGMHSNSTTR